MMIIKNIAWVLFRFVLLVFIIIDAIAEPVYRPVINWLNHNAFLIWLESRIATMPRLAILLLLAVPFAIAEPLKILALFIMASGHPMSGLILLAFSYLLSFLVVERIYHAGRDKLLTYGWLNYIMTQLTAIRDYLLHLKNQAWAALRRFIRLNS